MVADAQWGVELCMEEVRGHPCRVFRDRPKSLVQLLEGARRWGQREYLVDEERRMTFVEVLDRVDALASHLSRSGLLPGDRVALLARNSIEWVLTYWAVVRLGAVAVLGNAWWSEPETRIALKTVDARLVFADRKRRALLDPHVPVLAAEEVTRLTADRVVGGELAEVRVEEDEPAVILFTSGTTGSARGAILSHRSVIANQHGFLFLTRRLPHQLADDHRSTTALLSTPLFHTGGLQAITTALLTGGRLVFSTGKFEPARVMELMERERVTVWSGVPTMIQRVLEHPDAATRDLSSVKAIGLGGAPLPPHLLARIPVVFRQAGRGLSTNYGSTEAGGIVSTASGPQVLEKAGTSGRPLPHVEVRLGESDEILVRSSAMMSGYWGEAESPVDSEGWLHSGDVGRLDAEGYLYVVDRIKDIIIRGGENIAASHVEMALTAHPHVAGSAVIGLAHHDLGEEVAAVVVVRPGSQVSVEELRAFLYDRIAHFETPTRWWLRSEPLPENATGKTDKRALKASFPDRSEHVSSASLRVSAVAGAPPEGP